MNNKENPFKGIIWLMGYRWRHWAASSARFGGRYAETSAKSNISFRPKYTLRLQAG